MAENTKKNEKQDELKKEKDQKQENLDKEQDSNATGEASAGNETAEDNGNKEEPKEEPKDELTIAKEKAAEFEDKYKRQLAEFDNYRKRTEKEKIQNFEFGTSMALTKFLPIVDTFELALKNVPEDLKGNAFVEGIDKTYKQILKTFEDMDVKPIDALNKPFDVKYHNAVMTDETSDAEVDTITEVMQTGWTYKDQVLRPSMVKVKK